MEMRAGRVHHFGLGERLTLTWLVITGVIHMLVEGEDPTPGCSICAHRYTKGMACISLHKAAAARHLYVFARRAGAVVLNADFYMSTSKNILFEICKQL